MKKWEYKITTAKAWKTEEDINNLGQEGWELVAIHFAGALYFKREVK